MLNGIIPYTTRSIEISARIIKPITGDVSEEEESSENSLGTEPHWNMRLRPSSE